MMRLHFKACAFAYCGLALSACGGGASTTPSPTKPSPSPSKTSTPTPSPTLTPTPTPTSASASFVYAGSSNGSATVEYGTTGTASLGTLGSIGAPASIAFDASGDIYVASGGTIDEFAVTTHALLRTIGGFTQIGAVAVDPKGNLYVIDGYPNGTTSPSVTSHLSVVAPGATAASRVIVTVAPGDLSSGPFMSLAIDASGDVYAGTAGGILDEFAPGATSPTRTISQAPYSVASLLVDSSGNLYAFDDSVSFGEGFINKYAPGGTSPVLLISGGIGLPQSPQSLAVDSKGDLFELNDAFEEVANPPIYSTPAVFEFSPGTTTTVNVIAPLVAPIAIAVDPLDNLYVLDADATGTGEQLEEYPAGATTPTRTFAASGSAIGLSGLK